MQLSVNSQKGDVRQLLRNFIMKQVTTADHRIALQMMEAPLITLS